MGNLSSKLVVLAAVTFFTLAQVSATPVTIAELESDCYIDSVESVVQELLSYDATVDLAEEDEILIGYNLNETDMFDLIDEELVYNTDIEESEYVAQDYIAEEQMLENYMYGGLTTLTYENYESDYMASEDINEDLLALVDNASISFAADLEDEEEYLETDSEIDFLAFLD